VRNNTKIGVIPNNKICKTHNSGNFLSIKILVVNVMLWIRTMWIKLENVKQNKAQLIINQPA